MERSRAYRFFHNNEEWIAIKPVESLNLEHIETVSGSKDEFYIDWELADRRKMRTKQRRLFFALINDIVQWSVMPLCRTHHENYHQLGAEKFAELYHVPVDGIKLDVETLKKLKIKGNYESQ